MAPPAPRSCNVCGGPLREAFPRVLDPQTREEFSIASCQQCGLGHTSPQPEELGRYYGPSYHGKRHGFTASYCAARRVRFVKSVTEGTVGKALDIGCGDGTFLLALKKHGWSVVGTEMNPALAREAGLEVEETLDAVAGRGPFDCVSLWHSLEHMRDPAGLIEQVSRLLSPKGVLLIAVPNAGGLQAKLFGPRWFHLDVPRHLFHFTDRALERLLQRAGLAEARRWDQELEMDLFGWAQSALNALLPDPNIFFYALTHRRTEAGLSEVALSHALGPALLAAAVPAVAVGTALGRGGTLVVAARRA